VKSTLTSVSSVAGAPSRGSRWTRGPMGLAVAQAGSLSTASRRMGSFADVAVVVGF
jgi:hypothetical protein